ncbi:MAG: VanZ family protein [Candidatus Dojkabacteria bacterium]
MKNPAFILYNWGSAAAWFGVILIVSSIPNLDIVGDVNDWVLRAVGYALMYGLLFLLIMRALLATFRAQVDRLMYWKSKREQAEDSEFAQIVEFLLFLVAVLISVLLAAFDEYFQSGISGRVGDIVDVFIAAMGMIITSVLVLKFPIIAEFEARLLNSKKGKAKKKKR